jgi:hypothetical protein
MEGSGCDLILGTILAFAWRGRKTKKNFSQDSLSKPRFEHRTFPNMKQEF